MSEDGVQCRHGPRRDALAAGGRAATAAEARFRRLAGRDVGLRALDLAELERTDLPTTEESLDVGFDPASIHRQCGSLDGAPTPAKNASRLCFGKVPVADLGDGQAARRFGVLSGGVESLGHGHEFLVRDGARLLDSHQPVAANDDPPWATLRVAILDDEALQSRRHDLHAEASQLAIPEKMLPNLDPNLGSFQSFEGLDDALCELFTSDISDLPEICLESTRPSPPRRIPSTWKQVTGESRIRAADLRFTSPW